MHSSVQQPPLSSEYKNNQKITNERTPPPLPPPPLPSLALTSSPSLSLCSHCFSHSCLLVPRKPTRQTPSTGHCFSLGIHTSFFSSNVTFSQVLPPTIPMYPPSLFYFLPFGYDSLPGAYFCLPVLWTRAGSPQNLHVEALSQCDSIWRYSFGRN